jgi:hypothetical protein
MTLTITVRFPAPAAQRGLAPTAQSGLLALAEPAVLLAAEAAGLGLLGRMVLATALRSARQRAA